MALRGPWRNAAMAAPLALVGAYALSPEFAGDGEILNTYNLCAVASSVAMIVAVITQRPKPVWPWLLIAVAVIMWVLGDAVYMLVGGFPIVSAADAFYIPAYLAIAIACARFLRSRVRQRDTDTLLDVAMITIAAALALWELVVAPAWSLPGVSATELIMAAAYPLLDVVLLCMLIQLLVVPGRRLGAIVLLASGVGAIFVADLVYAVLVQTDDYAGLAGRLLDSSWLLGYALLAVAALHPTMRLVTRPATTDVTRRRGRLLLAGAALLTVPVIDLVVLLLGREPEVGTTVIAAATLVPLVLWRIVRLNQSSERSRGEVERQERYYRAMVVNSSDAFVVIDRDAKVLDASDALQRMLGFAPERVVGADGLSIVADEDHERGASLLAESVHKPGVTVSGEVRIRDSSDDLVWVELRCTNLLDDPAVGGIVVNTHDISGRKRFEHELEHRAFHDSLTSLANRALLRDRIDHAMTRRTGSDEVTVIFCDIDGFKLVNDTLGHAGGDALLRVVGERLLEVVRASDTVARVGGDEFAVLLERSGGIADEAVAVAERMRVVLSDPLAIAGTPMVVTASFGVAVASEGGQTTAEELLRDADAAMYRAKVAGRNQVVRYERGMRAAEQSVAELKADLPFAVERNQLSLRFQPVVELTTGRTAGFEALVRWDHPTRGHLGPVEFIELAEITGAIVGIGRWVLYEACRTAATWTDAAPGDPAITISVNLSPRQLTTPGFADDVAGALQDTGLDPARLVLELTESMLVDRPDHVATLLVELKELGLRLAIDDFGVGYSSLAYLRQFPVDILKIDRSFVETIDRHDRVPAIVHGLLGLARTLGLTVIAEGVQTDAQWRALAKEGCPYGQGHLFAKPLVASAAADRLTEPMQTVGVA